MDLWNEENSFAKAFPTFSFLRFEVEVQPCDFIAEVNGESSLEAREE